MEEFQAGILIFFITSWAHATVKVTTGGQICKMSYTYCNMSQPYCNILQYTFYTPVEDGTYYVITHGGWVGSVPHFLSGAYLQNYTSNGYEIFYGWIDLIKGECSAHEP